MDVSDEVAHTGFDADGRLPPLPELELPEETWSRALLTGIGTVLDSGVMRAMQFVVERALIPDSDDVQALRASAQATLDPALLAEPRRFFGFLDEPPHDVVVSTRYRRPLHGGAAFSRHVVSDYVPYGGLPAGEELPEPIRIHVEHWRHETRPLGTVVALHGFTMGRPRIDAVALLASQWYQRGLDVALMTLPYHGARTPEDARFSGEHFAVPDVARLGEAVREAIYEIRQVTHWLREESGAPVGLLGLSLGGYLTALAAGLYEELDFAIPMVPPVCIGDLAWQFFARTRHAREGGESVLSEQELRRSFRVHSPLAHPLQLPRERVMIIAGRGDRIVPPGHPVALWKHWDEPALRWFSGSHLAPFGRKSVVRAIEAHLRSLGIL